MERPVDRGSPGAPAQRLPPARSGPKSLIAVAAAILVFLGLLWYASFVALNARGPDRAFLTQTEWSNGTVVLTVTELDERGEVLASSLTAAITTQANERLYSGAFGRTVNLTSYTLTVDFLDNDHSTTLTRGDEVRIRALPPEAADHLILTNFYLYSDGREWARLPLPAG